MSILISELEETDARFSATAATRLLEVAVSPLVDPDQDPRIEEDPEAYSNFMDKGVYGVVVVSHFIQNGIVFSFMERFGPANRAAGYAYVELLLSLLGTKLVVCENMTSTKLFVTADGRRSRFGTREDLEKLIDD